MVALTKTVEALIIVAAPERKRGLAKRVAIVSGPARLNPNVNGSRPPIERVAMVVRTRFSRRNHDHKHPLG